jgi:tetratricopeptide (TPR) repeat protein
LLEKIGGNPLYAEQYARAFVERGDLVDLPQTVHGVIAARLDALSPEEKRLLQDAAVVGQVFWLGALAAIGEVEHQEVEDLLHRLERKQFVQRARRTSVAGEAEYAFRHVLLSDVAYSQIPRGARGEKHRRAAGWIESRGRAEDHAELVADHYVNALQYARAAGGADRELVERAGIALRDAGDRAAALAAYATAVRFYEAALELSPAEATLLLRLGRTRFSAASGGGEELEAAFEALRDAGDTETAAEAAVNLRMIAWYEGDGDRARRWLDQALELVRDRADSPVRAMALVTLGGTYHVNGEYEEAIRVEREALPLVERLGLDVQRARALSSIGISRASLGDPEGIADLEQSVEIARAAGDLTQMHASMNNLSNTQSLFGRTADAATTYEELVDSMERFGRDTDRRWGRASLATIRMDQGRWDEALELLDPYIAEVEGGSPHYLEPQARVARASIRIARGDLAGASADTERALEAARLAEDAQLLAPALAARANVLLEEGKRVEATALVDEALELGDKLVPPLSGSSAIIEFASLVRALGRERLLLVLLETAPKLPWVAAGHALASGEPERAADLLAQLGCPPAEAYARLRTAEDLVDAGRAADAEPHAEAALRFYRSVGATRFVDKAESIRARSPDRDSASTRHASSQ